MATQFFKTIKPGDDPVNSLENFSSTVTVEKRGKPLATSGMTRKDMVKDRSKFEIAMNELPDQLQQLVRAYLSTGCNKKKAAAMAGLTVPSMADLDTWFDMSSVRLAVEAGLVMQAMSANECLAHISMIARGPTAGMEVTEGGYVRLDAKGLEDAGQMGLIKKLKYDDANMPEVEFHDRVGALKLIAQRHALLTDVQRVDVEHGVTQEAARTVMVAALANSDTMEKLLALSDAVAGAQAGAGTPAGVVDVTPAAG